MLIAKEDNADRYEEFILLLHSSTFDDQQKDEMMRRYNLSDESEVDDLIHELYANQMDFFDAGSYKLKYINKKLDRHGCDKGNK